MANSVDKAAACHVAQLAHHLLRGYLAHIAAVRSVPRVDGNALVRLIADWPSDFVQRKDGTKWSFDTQDALVDLADKAIDAELPRVWLTGSLLALGDALKEHHYFDRAPALELVYHLRNGIAHGNRFNFTAPGLDRLTKYPAHNRDACFRKVICEIAPALNGQVILFAFMGAGDVLDLLSSVGAHLRDLTRRCSEPLAAPRSYFR
jgi:hypothetical protein